MCEAPANPTLGLQPELADGVIALGPFRLEDAPVMVQWDRDPELQRRFDWPETRDMPPVEEHRRLCEALIQSWWQDWTAGMRFGFAVREHSATEAIGACDLHPGGLGWAAAYNIVAEYRGRAYAQRALTLLIGWAFDVLGVQHIDVDVEVDNAASRRVAKRVGFVEVDRFPGDPYKRYGPLLGHVPRMIRYRCYKSDLRERF